MSRPHPSSRSQQADQRGSVLIFVVGVLLLLAIVATAFLSTSRADRTSTQQNAYNTQIDLLFDGVKNAVIGQITADARYLSGANSYDAYNAFDASSADTFLAARMPSLYNPNAALAGNPPMWTAITAPLLDSSFSSPFDPTKIPGSPPASYATRQNLQPSFVAIGGQTYPGFILNTADLTTPSNYPAADYGGSAYVVPAIDTDLDGIADAGMVKVPVGPIAGVTYYYGARIVDMGSALNVNTAWQNNDPTTPGAPQYPLLANFFPTNVDLLGLLAGSNAAGQQAQMGALNLFRSGNVGSFNLTPVDDNAITRTDFTFAGTNTTSADALWNQLGRRVDNPGYNSTTVKYQAFGVSTSAALAAKFVLRPSTSSLTALDNQLGASLVNTAVQVPRETAYPPNASVQWYQENFDFPSAATTLFPNKPLRALLTATSPSGTDDTKTIEQSAPATGNVPAWAATTVYTFGDLVSFAPTAATTSRNFVCIQPHTAAVGNGPDTGLGQQFWSLVGWKEQGQKVAINTADFGELWWGFRRVMAATLDKTVGPGLAYPPFPLSGAGYSNSGAYPYTVNGPYPGAIKARQFRTPIRDPVMTTQFGPTGAPVPAGSRFLSPSEMLQVRTAIAAVNAMDVRDNDSNVTARQIYTYDFSTTPPTPLHDVIVFGTEMQPYITEVYVNADTSAVGGTTNPNGYVAIELYNPYPTDINMNGWAIGLIDRTNPAPATRVITPLLDPAGGFPNSRFENSSSALHLVIPKNGGRVILENFSAAPLAGDAAHRPTEVDAQLATITVPQPPADMNSVAPATGTTPAPVVAGAVYFKYVPNLSRVMAGYNGGATTGSELVLVRPRNWSPDGTTVPTNTVNAVPFSAAAAVEDPCYEGVPPVANLADWVPADSFDFFGMAVPPATATTYSAWHYTRPCNNNPTPTAGNPANAWKWVHGGPYLATAAAGTNRQGVAVTAQFNSGAVPAFPPVYPLTPSGPTGVMLGQDKAYNTFEDLHTGTQVNMIDWPTVNAAVAGTNNKTPFGAFAQQTDLFRVPYIGAYTVRSGADAPPGQLPTASPVPSFTEMNALPMDFNYADDQDEAAPADPAPPAPAPATNNAVEQVGRFCPLNAIDPYTYRNWPGAATPVWVGAPTSPPDWYDFGHFATTPVPRTLVDVFTTQSPLDDALPNVSADEYSAATAATVTPALTPSAVNNASPAKPPGVTYAQALNVGGTTVTVVGNTASNLNTTTVDFYKGAVLQVLTGAARGQMATITASTAATPPAPVLTLNAAVGLFAAGDKFRILGTPEDSVGTQGLININTAPWPVLARLPLAFTNTGTVDRVLSEQIAKRIVTYRDGDPSANGNPTSGAAGENLRAAHGPFRSILDLNKVLSVPSVANPPPAPNPASDAIFQTGGGVMTDLTNTDYPGLQYGDITPNGAADNVPGDFENRLLALSRVSNLITTRSDAFVVYITLQGWRDAGTANASLVTQRRAAFIVDRSGMTQTMPTPRTTRVPSN